jgi:hypothetical protein
METLVNPLVIAAIESMRFIRQGAYPIPLGTSAKLPVEHQRTISRSGCLFVSNVMSAAWMDADENTTRVRTFMKYASVPEIHAYLVEQKSFAGSGLKYTGMKPLGVEMVAGEPYDFDTNELVEWLDTGRDINVRLTNAVVGVNYKPGASSGASDADHFMLVHGLDPTRKFFLGVDPTFGAPISIPIGGRFMYSRRGAVLSEMRLMRPFN